MPLRAETLLKAREELSEPADIASVVEQAKQEVIASIGEEELKRFDWALLAMLRQAKWNREAAVKKMCALSAYAAKNPQLFAVGTGAGEFLDQAALGMMSHLPTRNSRGELVLLLHGERLTPYAKAYSMTDMLRFSVFYMSTLLRDEETQVNGAIILENLDNYPMFALQRMKGAGPTGIKATFDWLHVSPLRLRGLYACQQPWYVGIMLRMVKPFMSTKLQERVRLFGDDHEAMLEAAGLTPAQVPVAFGGSLEGFDPAWHLKPGAERC